ncbi:MAG: transporter, family, multidrug resistance protein [Aliidongia sp.]|jgi:DHA1 family bicyclomycin/chloramphenicol resistance-like MFS transporter|nr:transporter, family, multidrug resistance protein [Aliidongia sp.]
MLSPGSLGFVVLLGALTALNALAIDMSLPALPEFERVFAADPDQVQWTLSGFLLGFSVGQLCFGPLSDRHGRKPLLLLGLSVFALGGFGCAVSPGLGWLVAARFLQGIGACVGPVLGRAMVRDLFERHRAARMMSHMTVVMSVAPLLAPIAGGYLLEWIGWQAIFVFLGGAGMLILAVVALRLRESLDRPDLHALRVRRLVGNYRAVFQSRGTLGFAAVSGLLLCGLFVYISGAPFVYIEVFGLRSDRFGYFFAIPAMSLVGGGFANATLLRYWDGEKLLQCGLLLVLGAGVAMVVEVFCAAGIWGVALPVTFYVFGLGLITPNATAAAMEPHPNIAGFVSSLIGCLQIAGAALASWMASRFYDHTAMPMATGVLGFGAAAFLIYHIFVRTRPGRGLSPAAASSGTR